MDCSAFCLSCAAAGGWAAVFYEAEDIPTVICAKEIRLCELTLQSFLAEPVPKAALSADRGSNAAGSYKKALGAPLEALKSEPRGSGVFFLIQRCYFLVSSGVIQRVGGMVLLEGNIALKCWACVLPDAI